MRVGDVILARGLEVDIARDLARRLGIPRSGSSSCDRPRDCSPTATPPWHLAIASIRPTRATSSQADLSEPYLGTDQAVVLRRGLPRWNAARPRAVRIMCALRGSDGCAGARGVGADRPCARLGCPRRGSSARPDGSLRRGARRRDEVGRFVAGRAACSARSGRESSSADGSSSRSPGVARSRSPRWIVRFGGCGRTARCTDSPGRGSGSIRRGCALR